MRNIKLVVKYDGTRYKGFQRLNDSNTIQEKLEGVISKMVDEKIEINASGRTDAGVHAIGQVVNFRTNSELSVKKIKSYINEYLPEDIYVSEVSEVEERFHSRYNATSKVYLYKINNKDYNPVMRKYENFVEKRLNVGKMREAAEILVGTHDFTSFVSSKSKKKSNVRTINSIVINETNGQIEIFVDGDGFLYNMVRIIVGSLIDIGLGKKTKNELIENLEAKDRSVCSETAKAKGLYLYRVDYK
ncbi:MAG: tRNA pseudouridine(38-40) synthase TruA [Peptostreptococcaceae bacterium]